MWALLDIEVRPPRNAYVHAWIELCRDVHGFDALGSKACAARLAFPAATFPMGIARSTTWEGELIGFQSMGCGGRCRKRRSFETPETRLAKPPFGMSAFAAISKSAASSRPLPRERCADTFCRRW